MGYFGQIDQIDHDPDQIDQKDHDLHLRDRMDYIYCDLDQIYGTDRSDR